MYVCIPANDDAAPHTRRIVTAELQLRRCPEQQIQDARDVVTGLVTPLCRREDVTNIGLSIQRSTVTAGTITITVSAQGAAHLARREIPLPGPRPSADDQHQAASGPGGVPRRLPGARCGHASHRSPAPRQDPDPGWGITTAR